MAITRVFGRPVAGVVCKRHPGKKRYVVMPGEITIVKADTEFVEIDPKLVVDADGIPVTPTERYWRTASTIDPYHVIVDML
jgi:hypothetical protein